MKFKSKKYKNVYNLTDSATIRQRFGIRQQIRQILPNRCRTEFCRICRIGQKKFCRIPPNDSARICRICRIFAEFAEFEKFRKNGLPNLAESRFLFIFFDSSIRQLFGRFGKFGKSSKKGCRILPNLEIRFGKFGKNSAKFGSVRFGKFCAESFGAISSQGLTI